MVARLQHRLMFSGPMATHNTRSWVQPRSQQGNPTTTDLPKAIVPTGVRESLHRRSLFLASCPMIFPAIEATVQISQRMGKRKPCVRNLHSAAALQPRALASSIHVLASFKALQPPTSVLSIQGQTFSTKIGSYERHIGVNTSQTTRAAVAALLAAV